MKRKHAVGPSSASKSTIVPAEHLGNTGTSDAAASSWPELANLHRAASTSSAPPSLVTDDGAMDSVHSPDLSGVASEYAHKRG